MNVSFQLIQADIVLVRTEARALSYDFVMLSQIARMTNGKSSSLSRRALVAANEIMSTFRRRAGDEENGELERIISKCRDIATKVLGNKSPGGSPSEDTKVWAIGHWWVTIQQVELTTHSHIDTAWLWRYTQTQQKIARSWSSQVDLMERFPNHHFGASSAQQYHWLETLYPSVFQSVKAQVKAGHFHPVGGAWLEHDCLLPSGESLCRQYLLGQRYFEEKFGVRCKEAWLPDTFGYASQLPQILRLAGIKYFFTQKVSVAVNSLHIIRQSALMSAIVEQHQHLPTLDVQLGRPRWLPGLVAHDTGR